MAILLKRRLRVGMEYLGLGLRPERQKLFDEAFVALLDPICSAAQTVLAEGPDGTSATYGAHPDVQRSD